MNRRNLILGILGAAVFALGIGLVVRVAARPPADRLLVAGDVRVDSRTIMAPTITPPTLDVTVGIPSSSTPTAKRPSAAPARSNQPTVSGTLTRVNVVMGDSVKTGQVVAQLDTKLLDLGVKQAKADAARQKANVAVLNRTLDTLSDALDKLPSARATAFATVDTAIATAKATLYSQHAAAVAGRPKLVAGIAKMEAGVAGLKAGIAQIQGALSHLPANDPQVPGLKAQLKKLKAQLKSLSAQLATLKATLAGINTFLKQWPTILKTFAAQTASASATAKATINAALDKAQDQITTGQSKVKNARNVLKIVADSSHVGIDLAQARRSQATILSPVDGIVTFAAPSGTVAMVGAPIVRIWPSGPALIDTYLTADQLKLVHVGSVADITYDSAPGKVLHGKVAIVGTSAEYPPTSFPTDIVHMTRTVKVSLRLDSGESPPQGTPVDISIHTN